MSTYVMHTYRIKNVFISETDENLSVKLEANERIIHVLSSKEATGHAGVNLRVLVEKTN